MRNIICFTIIAVCVIVVLHLFNRTSATKPFPTDPNDPALIIRKLPNGGVERIMTKQEEADFNLTEAQFEKIKEDLRKQKEDGIKNRPAPQGDYQWEGYFKFNGGFGQYQALYFKNKVIGGLFKYDGKYHEISPDGCVGKICEPPVPLRPLK